MITLLNLHICCQILNTTFDGISHMNSTTNFKIKKYTLIHLIQLDKYNHQLKLIVFSLW